MTHSKDVVERTLRQALSRQNPANRILSCVKAMDHLKSPKDPKLNMSLSFIQSEISKAIMQMTFNNSQQQKRVKAVNENVQTKH